jgi:hypothetical protein
VNVPQPPGTPLATAARTCQPQPGPD